MEATPDIMRTALRIDQDSMECVPFSFSVLLICFCVAAEVTVVRIAPVESGAYASNSFCAPLLLALLLLGLTLMGLARLAGLQSLAGLMTRRATSTA
jgi:hypothetical protein